MHNELDSLQFYHSLIKSVMLGMSRLVTLPEKGHLWPIVDASNLVHWAGEAVMSQAAITRTCAYSCILTPETFAW